MRAQSTAPPCSGFLITSVGEAERLGIDRARWVHVHGTADVDESMLTGESNPVARAEGDRVVAGSVATDGALRLRVDAVGATTPIN